MTTFMWGARLAKARQAAGLTQAELGVALGIYRGSVSNVESGRRAMTFEGVAAAAVELGVSLDYLAGLTEESAPVVELVARLGGLETGVSVGEARLAESVDVVEVAAAAGSGAETLDETPVGRVWFTRGWLRRRGINPVRCNVISVMGESMEPTLPSGCSILVDRGSKELHAGGVYVMRTDEGLVVKRLAGNRHCWWLVSDNHSWMPAVLTEDIDVIGRVRWVGAAL